VAGSLLIRRLPLVTVVSFSTACRLLRVWALASSLSVALMSALRSLCFPAERVDRYSAMASSMLRWAYQTARIDWAAKPRMAVR
jgi:hypothetical protein